MTKIQVPRTPKGVMKELGEVGELLTATEWKRAALLASVVRLPGRGARREERTTTFFTANSFADLGITGLRSDKTVHLYVQRWLDANDGVYPELGSRVELPDLDWPPTRTGTDGYGSGAGAARMIERIVEKHGPEVIAAAVRRPDIARAVDRDQEASREVLKASVARAPRPTAREPSGAAGDLLNATQVMVVNAVVAGLVRKAHELHGELTKHPMSDYPWRPNARELLLHDLDDVIRLVNESKEMLTVEVTDEALRDLLS